MGFNLSWAFERVGVVSPNLRLFLTFQTVSDAFINVFIACFDQFMGVLEEDYFICAFNQNFDILPRSRLSHPISSCCLVALSSRL